MREVADADVIRDRLDEVRAWLAGMEEDRAVLIGLVQGYERLLRYGQESHDALARRLRAKPPHVRVPKAGPLAAVGADVQEKAG